MTNASKLHLPRVIAMTLTDFSIYTAKPVISETFPNGVFCLAGANGLGKSTFLTALNYGITGIVASPDRKFDSVPEYYKHNQSFAHDFFEGRIIEHDRENATVSIELVAGGNFYQLTRNFFEAEALRALTIRRKDRKGPIIFDGKKLSNAKRHEEYTRRLAIDTGFASFDQFVFLVHFVMTFDERRHLLFWDPKVLEQALHIAFGVDRADAARADTLRREAERADSLARNANWQASEVRKKIEDLESEIGGSTTPDDKLVERHRSLLDARDESEESIDKHQDALRDASLSLTDLSAQQAQIRSEYSAEFNKRIHSGARVEQHPLIVTSLSQNACGLCGAQERKAIAEIKARCSLPECIFCGSELNRSDSKAKDIKRLKELDTALAQVSKRLTDAATAVKRLSDEIKSNKDELAQHEEALRTFERDNKRTLSRLKQRDSTSSIDAVLKAYREQMNAFLKKKDEHYAKRDEKRREQKKITQLLEKQYRTAETTFVPLFRDLAKKFLGLDLDIRMDAGKSTATLVLEVRDAARRRAHQLSESQRFFVDIALRMALIQYMTEKDGRTALFLDTPEGSLDIAYESRAGDMLAKFVTAGHDVIMTANINTSRLLLSLAEACGSESMVLCRMTSWADLSDVQQEEEALFKSAFQSIEKALKKRPKN